MPRRTAGNKENGGKRVDFYEMLHVERTATKGEIRKAYLVLARKLHPDKNLDSHDEATENFKKLSKAYEVLKDPAKRERYDRTGCTDEENSEFWDAYERYRSVPVTEDDIEAFMEEYRGSQGEKEDLEDFVTIQKGDVSKALSYIIGSRDEDRVRYTEYFATLLEQKGLEPSVHKKLKATYKSILSEAELDDEGEELDSNTESRDEEDSEEKGSDSGEIDFIDDADQDEEEYDDADQDEEENDDAEDESEDVADESEDESEDVADESDQQEVDNDDHEQPDLGDVDPSLVALLRGKGAARSAAFSKFEEKYKRKATKVEKVSGSNKRKRKANEQNSSKSSKKDELDPALVASIRGKGKARSSGFSKFEAKYTKRAKK